MPEAEDAVEVTPQDPPQAAEAEDAGAVAAPDYAPSEAAEVAESGADIGSGAEENGSREDAAADELGDVSDDISEEVSGEAEAEAAVADPPDRDEISQAIAEELPKPKSEKVRRRKKRKVRAGAQAKGEARSPAAKAAVAAGWALLALFVAGTGYGFTTYKSDIVRLWPATASLYAAFNDPVDLRGMEFQRVSYKHVYENGVPVLSITGEVVNVSDDRLPVPKVRIGLRDENQKELYYWTFGLPESALEPEQSAEFVTRLSAPPAAARDLEITFVEPKETPES